MPNWFDHVLQTLAARSLPVADVRRTLEEARLARARVTLEAVSGPAHGPLVTSIELVREEDVVVSRPVVGGRLRPLTRDEVYTMRFTCPRGEAVCSTESLGRVKVPSGGDTVLFGYRLAFPKSLEINERRREFRIILRDDLVREAELSVLSHEGPIGGLLEDISATGARMRCRTATRQLDVGRPAIFRIELPEPIGTIRQMVTVAGTSYDEEREELQVRLCFDERNEAISEVLRHAREAA